MRLDNIIYDVESLANAITDQWNTESPAFQAVYPSDTAASLANTFAAYGAMLQYCLVSALANCYTETAFSESAIYQLAETLGNTLHGNNSSQVRVKITRKNLIGITVTIPANSSFLIEGKKFFNPVAITLPATIDEVRDIILVQGEPISVLKRTNGIPYEKIFFCTDFKVNHNYVKVYVEGQEWNVDDSFLYYDKNTILNESELNTVVLKTQYDGRTYIKFGDNELGALPANGSLVTIEYVINDGVNGNISEVGKDVTLDSSLLFDDSHGNLVALDCEIITTSTAFGGFSKQSLRTLKETSPYIFASGHRAVRRQDYEALLQNKCGYLTSKVWGEYEESNLQGAYDSIMMNTVYYTGIKSFERYPEYKIGDVSTMALYSGTIGSSRGFYGSHTLKLSNVTDKTDYIILKDNDGKGQLFINEDALDPRDSGLPDWSSANISYVITFPGVPITNGGQGYRVDDTLTVLDQNNRLTGIEFVVDSITGSGAILNVHLTKRTITPKTEEQDPSHQWIREGEEVENMLTTIANGGYNFNTKNLTTSERGKLCTVQLINSGIRTSNFISTNEEEEDGGVTSHDITNARSDNLSNTYYRSTIKPSLTRPLQIRIDFVSNVGRELAAIKFQAVNPESAGTNDRIPFLGTIAVYGSNEQNTPSYTNVRNSNKWTQLLERKVLTNPWGNNNSNWTDWIPLNTFTHDHSNGKPIFDSYKHYVIEIYSSSDDAPNNFPGFNRMKLLYGSEASVIYYEENGNIYLNLPVAGSPGPNYNSEHPDCYLSADQALINSNRFPLYKYQVDVNNVTRENGYRDGNILIYQHKAQDTNNTITTFKVQVLDVDNQDFKIFVDESELMTGKVNINSTSDMSLDTPVYKIEYDTGGRYLYDSNPANTLNKGGKNYSINDLLEIKYKGIYKNNNLINVVNASNELIDLTGIKRGRIVPLESPDSDGNVSLIKELKTTNPQTLGGIKANGNVDYTYTYTDGDEQKTKRVTGKLNNEYKVSGITFRVTNITNDGAVTGIAMLNDVSIDMAFVGKFETNLYKAVNPGKQIQGSGLQVVMKALDSSGNGTTKGSGGSITINTIGNIELYTSFTGNRIDNNDVASLDQPIIDKYNHFTTAIEFKQPKIVQKDIIVEANLKTNAYMTSGTIIQEIKNNIYKLFEITPFYMGQGLKLSDIYEAVIHTKNVNWCRVISPTINIDINNDELLVCSDVQVIEVTPKYK